MNTSEEPLSPRSVIVVRGITVARWGRAREIDAALEPPSPMVLATPPFCKHVPPSPSGGGGGVDGAKDDDDDTADDAALAAAASSSAPPTLTTPASPAGPRALPGRPGAIDNCVLLLPRGQ